MPATWANRRAPTSLRSRGREFEADGKLRPGIVRVGYTFARRDLDGPAKQGDKLVHHGHAEARAFFAGSALAALAFGRVEKLRGCAGGHSHAVVAHANARQALLDFRGKLDLAARMRELDRVGE